MKTRRWRPRIDPFTHGLVCPRCKATFKRHGFGGKRRCREGSVDCCPGLVCTCGNNHFVERDGNLIWRRSPCPGAVCKHCGWTGTLRSVDFERTFGLSRCSNTANGCHDVHVVGTQNEFPGDLKLKLYCRKCSIVGYVSIDPIDGISWVDSIAMEGSDEKA